jgi:hypothetical protein
MGGGGNPTGLLNAADADKRAGNGRVSQGPGDGHFSEVRIGGDHVDRNPLVVGNDADIASFLIAVNDSTNAQI